MKMSMFILNFLFIFSDGSSTCQFESGLDECFISSMLLKQIKACLESDPGYAMVAGPVMKSLLRIHGAKEEDMVQLESGSIHEQCPLDQQPLMSHRRLGAHRVLIDTVNKDIASANTHVISQFPDDEIVSEEGSPIPIRRSGNRHYSMAPTAYQQSSVSLAMAKINMVLLPDQHHYQENINLKHNISIDDQYLFRITRNLQMDDSYSPTPEGIHQDNTEISSVTLVGRYNVTSGGETRLWKLSAPTGNYQEQDFLSGKMDEHLLLRHTLEDPWETIFFHDRKLKHEARAVDGPRPCIRDVIVNLIRKPLKDGTDVKLARDSLIAV